MTDAHHRLAASPRPGGLVLLLYIQWGQPMGLIVSPAIRQKLWTKHNVTVEEVEECFANCPGHFLRDTRGRHKTKPPTLWFIAATDRGRYLKVIFIQGSGGNFLKSAFAPDEVETRIYARYGLEP